MKNKISHRTQYSFQKRTSGLQLRLTLSNSKGSQTLLRRKMCDSVSNWISTEKNFKISSNKITSEIKEFQSNNDQQLNSIFLQILFRLFFPIGGFKYSISMNKSAVNILSALLIFSIQLLHSAIILLSILVQSFFLFQFAFYIFTLLHQDQIYSYFMSKIPSSFEHKDLTKLSTQELRALLSSLQHRHEILQTKNQQLTNQAHDLRKVIKCVDKQNKEEIQCLIKKKKKLQQQVDTVQKNLNVMNKSQNYKKMMAFKQVMGQ